MLKQLLAAPPGFHPGGSPTLDFKSGIPIDIDPTLLRLGAIQITWHGLFTALGVLAGILLASRLAPRLGLSDETVQSMAWWAVIGGIVGARVLYVWENYHNATTGFDRNPLWMVTKINEGGLSIFGTIVGGAFAVVLFGLVKGVSIPRLLDLGAPCLVLGQAVGRVGDIINGEHHSAYVHPNTFALIPVRYISDRTQALFQARVTVHLAVGYEMLIDLAIFGLCLYLFSRRFRLGTGAIFWVYLLAYSVGRFLISPFRLDPVWVTLGGLQNPVNYLVGADTPGLKQAEVFAVACVLVALAGLYRALNSPAPLIEAEGAAVATGAPGPTSPAAPPPAAEETAAPEAAPVSPAPRRRAPRGRAALPEETGSPD